MGRHVVVVDGGTRRHHERTGLEGVSAHLEVPPEAAGPFGLLELRPGVQLEGAGKRRHVDVFALGDHRSAHQRHQVLAADQPAQAADVGVEHHQVVGVALAPEQTLGEGRHQLAMAPHHRTVGREEDQAVVDRADCGPRIHLVAAQHDVDPRLARGVRDALGVFAGHDQRVVAKKDAAAGPLRQR